MMCDVRLRYHLFILDTVFLKRNLPTYLCVESPAILGAIPKTSSPIFINCYLVMFYVDWYGCRLRLVDVCVMLRGCMSGYACFFV